MGLDVRSISTVLNLLIQQLQFISLLNNLDVKWPVDFRRFLDVMNVFNLDPQDVIGEQEIPVIDFRVLFILISVVFPIFITVLILLLYLELTTVIWFFVTTAGCVLMVAGLLGRFLPTAGVGDDAASTAEIYLVIAGALLGASALSALIYTCWKRSNPDITEEGEKMDEAEIFERERLYLQKFHRARSFIHFAAASLLIVVGLVLIGVIDFNLSFLEGSGGTALGGMITIVAWSSLVVGGLIGLFFFANLTERGRKAVDWAKIFIKNNLLMLLILLISASYVPSMTYCMNMFLCASYDCPAGTVFNPYAFRDANSYNTSSALYCDPCTFQNPSCGAVTPTQLCPATSLLRNWQNPEVSCEDESVGYFFFAAALVLLVYLVCIPLLYRRLINYLSLEVWDRARYPNRSVDDPQHWATSLALVRPAAASLYEPFLFSNRYYSLLMLAHRLVVVTVLVVVAPFSTAAVPLILVVHAIACVFLLIKRPYLIPFEQGLGIGMAVCNVLNGMFAVIVWQQDGETPNYATGIYIFLNIFLPIALSIGMNVYISYRTQKMKEAAVGSEPTDEETKSDKKAAPANEAELKEYDKENTAARNVLNQATGEQMGKFFAVMGIFFFLALGACVLGTLRQKESPYIIGTNRFNRDIKYTLNNYESWANFSSTCCCLVTQNPSAVFNVTERWVCPGGNVVDRGRISKGLEHNSTLLRGICAESLSVDFCSIKVSERIAAVSCPLPTEEALVPDLISEKAYRYYW